MRRREAIALTATGIGSWGEVAKAADTVRLTLGGAAVNVRFGPGYFDLPRDEQMVWISTAARAVTVYYGRFPVSTAAIEVKPAADKAGVLARWRHIRRASANANHRRSTHQRPPTGA